MCSLYDGMLGGADTLWSLVYSEHCEGQIRHNRSRIAIARKRIVYGSHLFFFFFHDLREWVKALYLVHVLSLVKKVR